MKVSENDVRYVADLANLELTPEERVRMVRDLNSILEYVDRLNELDTAGVPPMACPQPVEVEGDLGSPEKKAVVKSAQVLRPDVLGKCLDRKLAVENAPDSDGTFFKVPKVIER
jgi:aspartyl-tRNA(Asn)/glutamyl-tRNA(Gln) amidotransferase subunit C